MELKIKRKEKPAQPEKQGSHKIWIGTYLFLLLACIATYFLLKLDVFEIFGSYRDTTQKILLGGIFGILILLASKITELLIEKTSHSPANRFNLVRVIRLLTF